VARNAPERPVEIVADGRITRIDCGAAPVPEGWVSRALYVGVTGARNWLGVVGEPNYPLRDLARYNLAANRSAAVQGRQTSTFVSLGPGDGLSDLEILRGLSGPGALRYIPVEISLPLLQRAIANLRPHAEVPVGIHCDFEDSRDFLAETVRVYARPPTLFGLVGGTVGNLDQGEAQLFAWVRTILDTDDSLLLDIPLAGPQWTSSAEPRLNPRAYSSAFRRFLGGTIDPQDPEAAAATFEQRVQLSLMHDAETCAEVITVADRVSQRRVLTFRRYRWEPILSWLRSQGFTVVFARSSIASDADEFGMGVVLLMLR
jgi:hypothetical protein